MASTRSTNALRTSAQVLHDLGDADGAQDIMSRLVERGQGPETATLCEVLFKHDLSPGQVEIARTLAFPGSTGVNDDRVCINAMTRYGKTYGVADGLSLRILADPGPLDIKIIGPTQEQATILRNYLTDNIIHQPLLSNELDLDATGIRRLNKEVSKRKFTFKNGTSLTVLTAEGKADRLMGFGADVLVLDESCLIHQDVFDYKISRMLGDNPDAQLVELSNPWHKEGHYYRHWEDHGFRNIHIGWRQALIEGRVTQKFIDEQRRVVPPTAFEVLYESVFPDMAEDQLIPWSWIQRAIKEGDPDLKGESGWIRRHGLDVAEGGGDATVLTRVFQHSDRRRVLAWQKTWHYADTMETADRAWAEMDGSRGVPVAVDATGVGKGVADRLQQKGASVSQIKTGRSASKKERFTNLGSEALWNLRGLFEEGLIDLHNPSRDLLSDLTKWRWTVKTGRVHVEVEDGKRSGNSPDHGDSLAYACWGEVVHGGPRKLLQRDPLALG